MPVARSDAMKTIGAFCDAWGSCDIEQILAFLTDDCFYHNIPIEPVIGKANIRGFLGGFLQLVETGEFRILAMAQSASGAVMTERIDRFCINGSWGELPVMGIFELENGRIAQWRDYYDQTEMNRILAAPCGEVGAS